MEVIADPGVTNLKKGWEDGRQVGALVDATAPGLCPGWKGWQAEEKVSRHLIRKYLKVGFLSIFFR